MWRSKRSAAPTSGSSGAPLSTNTPDPPALSATRYAFESQLGSMLRSRIMRWVGCQRTATGRRASDGSDEPHVECRPRLDLQAARSGRGPVGHTRLFVRAPARAAPERKEGDRRGCHCEEAAGAPDPEARDGAAKARR